MSISSNIDLRSFRKKARLNKSRFRRFITRLDNNTPPGLPAITAQLEKEVWKETDCLSCANCCKTMTPTFKSADIKRVSSYLGMSQQDFKSKYLRREKGGDRDWLNISEPCSFLNPKDNTCSIYEVRPADCAGYPHLRKKLSDYSHVIKQNVECCPAAYRLVEKMMSYFSRKAS